MSPDRRITPLALLIAVVTALVVGALASLAVRPPGTAATRAAPDGGVASLERIRWRVASAYGSNLPVAGDAMLNLRDELLKLSAGAIELQIFEPGEVVPVFGITEAVRDGKIQAGFTWIGYDQGRVPASPLIAAVPFGLEPVEFSAWWYYAGGRELGEALYREHGVLPLLCAITGPETAGWFRRPIESLEDLEGLKIRFAGLGGKVMQRAGASVTMIPGGEIFQALEKGAIDAAEFSLPIVDQRLGFDRVAKFNYFPGWHQIGSANHLVVNLDTWHALTEQTRSVLRTACRASVTMTIAQSEALQGAVIRDFPGKGVEARPLPPEVLRELSRITAEVLDEEAAKDEHFARILASQRAFAETYSWWKRLGYLPRDF